MSTILLLNDNGDQNNWGAQATPYAIKRMLADIAPSITVRSFSSGWFHQQVQRNRLPFGPRITYRPRAKGRVARTLMNHLAPPVEVYPEIADEFERTAGEWLSGRAGPFAAEFLKAVEESDAVIHNGENSIYRNSPTGVRALFLLWLARTYLGKPSGVINQTAAVNAMARPIMRGMVKIVYPGLNVVTVREPASLNDLQSLGLSNVELVPDVVFYLDEPEEAEQAVREWKRRAGLDGRPYFCLGASSLPMSAPRRGWEGTVARLVTRLKEVVPQAVLMAKDSHCLFLKEVAARTGSVYFGPEHAFQELTALLRDAAFLVSGHYHYVIWAAVAGCPFIPLSTNNHKMEGLCQHLQWPTTQPFDATALGHEEEGILEEARRLVDARETLSSHLLTRASQLKAESVRNAILVRDLLKADGAASSPARAAGGDRALS